MTQPSGIYRENEVIEKIKQLEIENSNLRNSLVQVILHMGNAYTQLELKCSDITTQAIALTNENNVLKKENLEIKGIHTAMAGKIAFSRKMSKSIREAFSEAAAEIRAERRASHTNH